MELLPLVCLCLLSCSGDAVRVVVEEDSDAVLPCWIRTKEDLSYQIFEWKKDGQKKKEVFLYDAGVHYNNGLQGQDEQFKGRVSFFQDQLQNGDASIKITRTKMADSGTYRCDFPRHQPRQTFIIELVVGRVLKDRTGENIPAVRVVVEQDSDAVLPRLIRTKEDISYEIFDWRKDGQKEVFMYYAGVHYNNGLQGQDEQFKGRVSFFQDQLENGDASIKITRTKMADSGIYSCDFPRHQPSQTFIIELVVAVRVVVEQDSDAVLPCWIRTKEDITGKLFDWKKDDQKEKKEVFLYDAGVHYNNGLPGQDDQFKGRVSFFQDELKNGDASIKITRTKMADSGTYSCDFPRHQPSQTSIIELVVDPVLKDRAGENIPGLAAQPVINILAVTKDEVLLQCEARGVPPLTVEWKNAAGNILKSESTPISETGSPSYIALNIAVTKTDDYSCVATQEQFSHQVTAMIPVYIPVPPPESGSNTDWIITVVDLILILVFIGAVSGLYIKHLRKENRKKEKKKSDAVDLNPADPNSTEPLKHSDP